MSAAAPSPPNKQNNGLQKPTKAVELISRAISSGWRINSTLFKTSPKLIKCLLEKRKPTAVELRELFESLGVTYIKLGQFIASSPSIFPTEYVDAFQNCLDRTPAIPFKTIQQIIDKELTQASSNVFRYIDPSPLASASIAQVHAAILHNGQHVVVKVQKPGVEHLIDTDLNTAFVISRIIESVSPVLNRDAVTDIISEIHRTMKDECDFLKEAHNLEQFNRFLQQQNIDHVIAPKTYPHACSKRLLTMERIYGRSFTDISNNTAEDNQSADNTKAALFNALNVWFTSIKYCDFFHADLHSGNLLLTDSNQVAFIDFGMVGRINDSIWSAAIMLVKSFSGEDFGNMAAAMITIGMTKRKVNIQKLEQDLEQMFTSELLQNNHDNPLNIMAQIARRHGIRFPSAFTLLVKQFLYFDSYLQLLAPESDLFDNNIFDDDLMKNFSLS